MTILHADLLRESRKVRGSGAWIWLFRLPFDVTTTATTVAYLAMQSQPVIFDDGGLLADGGTGGPKTFYPYPIQHGGIESNSDGNLPSMALQLSDITGLVGRYMFQGRGLSGEIVTIWLVHEDHLDTPLAHSRWELTATDIAPARQDVGVSLQAQNPAAQKIPAEVFSRRICPHVFGEELSCAFPLYVGGPTECDKTLGQCRKHGATAAASGYPLLWPRHFGGHPGIEEAS